MWFPDLLLALGGVALSLFGLSRINRRRLLLDTPTSTIRGVAMGTAELSGKAVQRSPLASPLTATPCVWWRFTIEQEQTGSKGERRWVKVNEGRSTDLFYLEDGTGRLTVDPMGAEMKIDFKRQWLGMGGFGGGQRRYTEWLILPTGRLYVFGHVKGVGDAAADRKERLTQALRDLKQDRARMATFDSDGDGRLGPEEWERAVEAVKAQVREAELAEAASDGGSDPDAVMVCRGPVEKTYVISDTGETGALANLAWTGYPALAAGCALLLLGIESLLAGQGLIRDGYAIPWPRFFTH